MTGLFALTGVDPADAGDLLARLSAQGRTVATAESLTGGLLTALLTETPGASRVLRGGLVVYATELKSRLAGVPADLLDRAGPVDRAVAEALADGARQRCGADIGVGLTGVAGPDAQDGHPAGTVFVAVVTAHGSRVVRLHPPGAGEPVPTRAAVRAAAVRAAVSLLRDEAGNTTGHRTVDNDMRGRSAGKESGHAVT